MKHSALRIKTTELLCGITILVALLSGQTGRVLRITSGTVINLLYYGKYVASLFLFVFALQWRKKRIPYAVAQRAISLFLPLLLMMILTDGISVMSSPVVESFGLRYWTRAVSVFLDRIVIWITIISIWALCGKECTTLFVKVLIMDQLIVLFSALAHGGGGEIVTALKGILSLSQSTTTLLEVHELTFCIGLMILYYLVVNQYRQHKKLFIILILFFLLGAKRIGIAAILLSGIVALLIWKRGFSVRLIRTVGIVGVAFCLVYLFILYNNSFFAFLSARGINSMGRDLVYTYFIRRTHFGISQLPWGVAGVSKTIEHMTRSEVGNMVSIMGLHNDILKIYINYGFFGALLWYSINLIYIPGRIFASFGKKAATVYMCLCIYMFVTYLTDNTESYFVCQVALFLIPLSETESTIKQTSEKQVLQ